jgi:protein O-GlcNAc transferase
MDQQTAEQFRAALAHHQAGRLNEAERLYRRVIDADPNDARCLHLLGVLSHQLGRGDGAALIARAAALAPGVAEIHNDHGVVLAATRRFASAAASFERAIALRPDYAEARVNLANALRELGRRDEAAAQLAAAIAADPKNPVIRLQRANLLQSQGRLDEALSELEHALALAPEFAEAHLGLGIVLRELGRFPEALVHCERAVALRPRAAGARNNLGNVLREMGRLDEAIAQYDAALALDPRSAIACYNSGLAFRGQSELGEAAARFARALSLDGDFLAAELASCMAQLPILYADEAQIARQRERYQTSLLALRDKVARAAAPGRLAEAIGSHQPFYLPYQGENDRDIQAAYGALVCRVMADRFPPPPLPRRPRADEPVRVGIVSGFFRRHSNWKVPMKGWLAQLDRARFRLFGYHTGTDRDGETAAAAALCERFVQGPLSVEDWRRTIAEDAPHILLYPEIGMDNVTAQLASQRLARVQCASWGHPVTSGFPTIDYFLSSDRMEPPDGERHYSERLVRLPNLSIYYEPDENAGSVERSAAARAALGLRASAIVYWCGQSLPKYLPRFDDVFPRIAREVGDCQFVFIEFAGGRTITELFRERLDRAFARFGLAAADHCIVLPRLAPDRFSAAVGQSDVVLDSIGWSGCNSTLESLAHDLPIVTLPGALMRGRHTAAILAMMDITATIASTVDDYVAIAARLGRDAAFRAEIAAAIDANKHRLYRDRDCIVALEDFLDRAARDGSGEPD